MPSWPPRSAGKPPAREHACAKGAAKVDCYSEASGVVRSFQTSPVETLSRHRQHRPPGVFYRRILERQVGALGPPFADNHARASGWMPTHPISDQVCLGRYLAGDLPHQPWCGPLPNRTTRRVVSRFAIPILPVSLESLFTSRVKGNEIGLEK